LAGMIWERNNNRASDEIRDIKITTNYTMHAEGSVLIECGNTKVICTATVSDKVPHFLKGQNSGWITAEYSMLPRATGSRNQREVSKGKQSGRTMEIQRLIGRALRTAVDLKVLGEKSITIDCDVIQADGGTRTASITGGYVALAIAINRLLKSKFISENPLIGNVAAISVGVVKAATVLDLEYEEDSIADVDMNLVMHKNGEFVEIQGTGENDTFSRNELNKMLEIGEKGIRKLFELQDKAIETTELHNIEKLYSL